MIHGKQACNGGSIHIAEGFFDAYRKRDLDKMVAQCNPEVELRYVPLGNQGEGKIGTTGRTVWTGLFNAVPDLTNREELTEAETTGEIEKIGEHVTSLKEGDRVIVFQKKGQHEEKDV